MNQFNQNYNALFPSPPFDISKGNAAVSTLLRDLADYNKPGGSSISQIASDLGNYTAAMNDESNRNLCRTRTVNYPPIYIPPYEG